MESKAITGNIRAGRRDRRKPLAPVADFAPEAKLRDLPIARDRPVGEHGIHSPEPSKTSKPKIMATGFFTDTTLCIGCKACEVACKQWNQLP